MTYTQLAILPQLIGLARATDGSPHLITPDAIRTVVRSLADLPDGDEALLQSRITEVIETKRAMAPNCFLCASPCGRTSSFDLALLKLEPQPVQQAKWELIGFLCTIAAGDPDEMTVRDCLFQGLIAVGTQPILESALFALTEHCRARAAAER